MNREYGPSGDGGDFAGQSMFSGQEVDDTVALQGSQCLFLGGQFEYLLILGRAEYLTVGLVKNVLSAWKGGKSTSLC